MMLRNHETKSASLELRLPLNTEPRGGHQWREKWDGWLLAGVVFSLSSTASSRMQPQRLLASSLLDRRAVSFWWIKGAGGALSFLVSGVELLCASSPEAPDEGQVTSISPEASLYFYDGNKPCPWIAIFLQLAGRIKCRICPSAFSLATPPPQLFYTVNILFRNVETSGWVFSLYFNLFVLGLGEKRNGLLF